MSQKCLPHDPLGLGKEIFNFFHILSKIRFPCNFSSVHSNVHLFRNKYINKGASQRMLVVKKNLPVSAADVRDAGLIPG